MISDHCLSAIISSRVYFTCENVIVCVAMCCMQFVMLVSGLAEQTSSKLFHLQEDVVNRNVLDSQVRENKICDDYK